MTFLRRESRFKWLEVTILVPLLCLSLPLLAILLLLAFSINVATSVGLNIVIWLWWCVRGRDVLFVYSDSPIWHDYIEQYILPYVGGRAIVLNWSKRKEWRFSLARIAFRHFGGSRQFNPLGVVFRPFRVSRVFRFCEPFRDLKHGHPEELQRMEAEFFELLGVQKPLSSG